MTGIRSKIDFIGKHKSGAYLREVGSTCVRFSRVFENQENLLGARWLPDLMGLGFRVLLLLKNNRKTNTGGADLPEVGSRFVLSDEIDSGAESGHTARFP